MMEILFFGWTPVWAVQIALATVGAAFGAAAWAVKTKRDRSRAAVAAPVAPVAPVAQESVAPFMPALMPPRSTRRVGTIEGQREGVAAARDSVQ